MFVRMGWCFSSSWRDLPMVIFKVFLAWDMLSRILLVVRGDARPILHNLAEPTGFNGLRSLRLFCVTSYFDGWCEAAESWGVSCL